MPIVSLSIDGQEVSLTVPQGPPQPSTACAFGVLCQTGAAAARNIDLDYCYCRSVLGQLWT
jgi:hypothetical protein